MQIDLRTLNTKDAYKLMTGAVVPRPIAWVSTIDTDGNRNLAPFSFFTVASRKPPMLCISIGPGVGERTGTVKDTLQNIRDTSKYVINILRADLGEAMHETSLNHAAEVDEFETAGLTGVLDTVTGVPRVGEAPISFELELDQILELGTDHLILGKVVNYHIQEEYYVEPYKVDLDRLNPLGRLAGGYAELKEFYKLPKVKGDVANARS